MNAEKRAVIFGRLQAINPTPTTELEYRTPFELLIAVLLSAQATDVSVNAATRKLFPKANTPQKIAKLGVAGVTPFIRTIGLYRTKAKHLVKTCELLIAHHGGAVPEHREALQALPGVGRKTANVVLNTAFGWDSIAVDTHIFRVAIRTKIGPGKPVMEVEKRLERLVPGPYQRNSHHWLILHGRYICKARKPECWRCPINDLCEFPTKTLPPD
ncbi:MAG: endonuclease III [Burkholderiaceae bacterium]